MFAIGRVARKSLIPVMGVSPSSVRACARYPRGSNNATYCSGVACEAPASIAVDTSERMIGKCCRPNRLSATACSPSRRPSTDAYSVPALARSAPEATDDFGRTLAHSIGPGHCADADRGGCISRVGLSSALVRRGYWGSHIRVSVCFHRSQTYRGLASGLIRFRFDCCADRDPLV